MVRREEELESLVVVCIQVSCAEMREGEVRAVVLTEHDPQERAIRARTSRSHPPEVWPSDHTLTFGLLTVAIHQVVASLIALPLFRDLALLASHNELGFAHTCGSPHMDVPKDDLLTPGRCSEHCWVFVFNERNAGCGSGIVDVGEECDDANDFSGDGCSRTCQVEPGTSPFTACPSCVLSLTRIFVGYQCWHSFSHPASVCYRDGDDRGSLLPSRRPSVSRWDMARAGYALSVSLLVLSALLFVAILGIALAIVMEPRLKVRTSLKWLLLYGD